MCMCSYFLAGQDDYDSLRHLSYFYTDVVLMCFCMNYPDSLENIKQQAGGNSQHTVLRGTILVNRER